MSSLSRPLSGDAITFDLQQEIETTRAAHSTAHAGRTARTLLKDGPLRVTLIAVQAGGAIAEHSADGPITVQVLTGAITMDIAGRSHQLRSGQLLAAAAGVRHAVRAEEDAAFLLTVVLPGQAD